MQIKVEVEVKPEELRRFLGLPDVAGLQDEVLGFLKEKLDAASDGISPATDFVKSNLDSLRRSLDLQKLLSSIKVRVTDDKPETVPVLQVPEPKTSRKRKTKADDAAAKPRGKRMVAKKDGGR